MYVVLSKSNMHNSLLYYLAAWPSLWYIIVFLGGIFEGDILLFSTAFFARQGFLNIFYLFPVLLAGVLLGDFLWYLLGLRFGESRFFLIRLANHLTKPFDNHLKRRPLHTMFISKFVYNFHHPILMRAGVIRMPLTLFIKNDIISTLGWIGIIGGLGYFSGLSFEIFKYYLGFTEVGLLAGALIFIVIHYIVSRELKREL